MQNVLYRNVLDPELFPELEREPGVYGIEAKLVDMQREKRVPAPKQSPAVLLASYTLLASTIPPGSTLQLEAVGLRDGKPHQISFALVKPPPKADNFRPITRDASLQPAPGTLFEEVFWIDLGPPIEAGTLLPGDALTLRYGNAAANLVLPPWVARR